MNLFLLTSKDAKELIRRFFLLSGLFFFNGFLEDRHRNIRVTHGTLLSLHHLGPREPLHKAIVVEDVTAGGHFADLCTIREGFHAYDALWDAELIDFFIVLPVVYDRDQLFVGVDERFVGHSPNSVSVDVATRGPNLSNATVSSLSLRICIPVILINHVDVELIIYSLTPPQSALEAE